MNERRKMTSSTKEFEMAKKTIHPLFENREYQKTSCLA
eukprot:CAMPEP_0113908600 /NCGR_PEP_ID=MMETSP0780_2-20120614/26272_1 /TAXON_ID=652834 /ORGANISM="Palpitomonas bilix" /LENGTH=37 /DNA_ID=CAMNT_0000904087 /DNA_START=479 /DNA_END=592 /DNA_ORIENTATION=- /assembly_acc=CAM_ASM_000599